jgi:hypothetical protein
MKGAYCRKCGEKRIVPERDFSLLKFLQLSLWHFIHFDSKLLRTLALLYTRPGFLTSEWIVGRRVGYMKPLQLFLVASVMFYFFLPGVAAHFASYGNLVNGYRTNNPMDNVFHYDAATAVASKASLALEDEAHRQSTLVSEAARHSKTWLFLIIPVWGSLIYLLFRKRLPWLGPHLIFAMHALTFYLLFDLTIHAVLWLTGTKMIHGGQIFLLLSTAFPVYQALALKQVYGYSWPRTLLATLLTASSFFLIVMLYRQAVTVVTIELL